MLIDQLKFKAGALPGAETLTLDLSDVTVLVGPNNSGKSIALSEIEAVCQSGSKPDANSKILSDFIFSGHSANEIEAILSEARVRGARANLTDGRVTLAVSGGAGPGTQIHEKSLRDLLATPTAEIPQYAQNYVRWRVLRLGGEQRLGLTGVVQVNSLLGPSNTPLHSIWRDDENRKKWREIVFRAFGVYPALNCLEGRILSVSMSGAEPTEDDEKTFKESAVAFHKSAKSIAEYSDGVRAFVGIMLQVMAGSAELVLIDEPEAFLHPNLCFMLGRELTKLLSRDDVADRPKRQLIAATHSPSFLMGCIQAKAKLNIVRLTYDAGVPTARLLPASAISSLMRRPLLRSSSAMAGIFFHSTLVGEADADRAFYQEINERLLDERSGEALENCLFLNANGKDTVPDLVAPLRGLGIAAAAVVDLDVLNQGGECWAKFMRACGVPLAARPSLEVDRANIHNRLTAKNTKYKSNGGLALLDEGEREAAQNLLDRLEQYGLFVVPVGEVEFWLPSLEVGRSKETWLRNIFDKLGDDPDAPAYVRPASGDVWAFISRIRGWVANPARKGLLIES